MSSGRADPHAPMPLPSSGDCACHAPLRCARIANKISVYESPTERQVNDSRIHVISSMATKRLLAELSTRFEAQSGLPVRLEAVGGVDAAKRVRGGEVFDVVVLAANVIDDLIAEGRIDGGRVDVATSPVAIAVRAGTPTPDIGSADAVKRAVLAAGRVGYSTGPSGTYLSRLFSQWGIADAVKDRITVAPPGVPVASLVARGEIDLGFQQLSELTGVDGIDVIGMLPPEIQSLTTFSGGVARTSTQPDAARRLLEFMASPEVAEVKREHGMDAA
jgi:molybdate transport system substrate-binding protein